ncbi:MAG: class I SAM-dependent DNA methyltransferase [Spirochaetia bacterium]|nr:class I SAM-dependent DNA methyltransferase [Spirochaetia bacterium]
MALSWNEIKDRALTFSKEWADASSEKSEAQPFLVEFFKVFGVNNRKVGTFEFKVHKLDDNDGYIDMLWPQTILIEMKSRGKDLEKAYNQAKEYAQSLEQHKIPLCILVCDFENFHLYNLEFDASKKEFAKKPVTFKLSEFVKNVNHFGFLAGYQKKEYKEQDPVNIKAAELMGKLHDRLEEVGYKGHELEVYLVRLLFCLFAEDTTIFNRQQFQDLIEQRTSEDGSDMAGKIQELFEVLNTSEVERLKNLDEQLAAFPYVNGELFKERLRLASFDSKMRKALLECCYLDWSGISPAIFGSMFQSVMNPTERRNLGAHYTSEKNIMKLIKPLFLDELQEEFEKVKKNKNKLSEFHKKLAKLKFLDPACGCGNFLVITYRELRLLELDVLKSLYGTQKEIHIDPMILVDVDQFYGIEIDEWPARISEVAMWLMDHQMNLKISNEFGHYYARLPLKKSAKIVNDNALRINWEDVVPKNELSYILGNPPFVGKHLQSKKQKAEQLINLKEFKTASDLDYVCNWFGKAARFIQETKIITGFVATNSIAQGEQVSLLWSILFMYKIKIHFAHRTFQWNSEAKNKAAVHCVIIGFATFDIQKKIIYDYDATNSDTHEVYESSPF